MAYPGPLCIILDDIYKILGYPNVFRYRKANEYTIDELQNNYILFQDRTKLNDPFDAHSSLVEVTHSETELQKIYGTILENLKTNQETVFFQSNYDIKTIRKFVDENIEGYILQFGIACFSMSWHNMPLWGNYALNHTGVCLHYDMNLDSNFFDGTLPVQYEENLETKEYSFSNKDEILALFYRKDAQWKGEEELRLLKHPKGKHNFNRAALKSVFLGHNIDKSFKLKIVGVIKQLYPHTVIYQIQKPEMINRLTLNVI